MTDKLIEVSEEKYYEILWTLGNDARFIDFETLSRIHAIYGHNPKQLSMQVGMYKQRMQVLCMAMNDLITAQQVVRKKMQAHVRKNIKDMP